MVGCSAFGCKNISSSGMKIHMFAFPRDPRRRKLWAGAVRRKNWYPTNNSKLCQDHFEACAFLRQDENHMWRLKPDAVPTIFAHKKATKTRKSPHPRGRNMKAQKERIIKTIGIEHSYIRKWEAVNPLNEAGPLNKNDSPRENPPINELGTLIENVHMKEVAHTTEVVSIESESGPENEAVQMDELDPLAEKFQMNEVDQTTEVLSMKFQFGDHLKEDVPLNEIDPLSEVDPLSEDNIPLPRVQIPLPEEIPSPPLIPTPPPLLICLPPCEECKSLRSELILQRLKYDALSKKYSNFRKARISERMKEYRLRKRTERDAK